MLWVTVVMTIFFVFTGHDNKHFAIAAVNGISKLRSHRW